MEQLERNDQLESCRALAEAAKDAVRVASAQRRADFDAQLAISYSKYFKPGQQDWETLRDWQMLEYFGSIVLARALQKIANRAKELGIPPLLAPMFHLTYRRREENAIQDLRNSLVRLAYQKIDLMAADVCRQVDSALLEEKILLTADGLESTKALLEAFRRDAHLLPMVTVREVEEEFYEWETMH